MRHSRELLDYEGVFPSRRSRPDESEPLRKTLPKVPEVELPSKQSVEASNDGDAPPSFVAVEAGKWQPKKGHGLTFASLFLFTVVLYLRPYELIPALSSFKSMAFY